MSEESEDVDTNGTPKLPYTLNVTDRNLYNFSKNVKKIRGRYKSLVVMSLT